MVMAAGSVMNEPSSGAMVRIENHHATGRRPPSDATTRRHCSASRMTGRVEASVMMMTTNTGSVKFTVLPM